MPEYFSTPFPFRKIIQKSDSIRRISLEDSIRNHIRSLVLMRIGEFAYDREMGFEMWDYDKQVFFHEREPYFESSRTQKGMLENASAKKHFKENLREMIEQNEIRLQVLRTEFKFDKVEGNRSVYQRKISIEVNGKVKSTGKMLTPPLKMSILYTPFKVESN